MAATAAAATTAKAAAAAAETIVLSVRHLRRKRVGRRPRPSLLHRCHTGAALRTDRRRSRFTGTMKSATADMVA